MLRKLIGACVGLAMMGMAGTANALLIHESATLGAIGQGGGIALGPQILGSRFSVTSTVQVGSIGGHIVQISGPNLFGAIIALSSPSALPTGSPLAGAEVIASTTFTGPGLSADILVPLSVTLSPGDYALVFGSQLFGATGFGGMPQTNTDLPGASYFFWNAGSSQWFNSGFTNARFVVSTVSIPEPSTLALFATGLAMLAFIGWRRRPRQRTQAAA